MPAGPHDAWAALAPHLSSRETQSVLARGRAAEIQRRHEVETVSFGSDEALAECIGRILGEGRLSGPVAVSGLAGVAALPPCSPEPFLLLRRPSPVHLGTAVTDALLHPRVARVASSLLASGAGVACAGPSRQASDAAAAALLGLCPPRWRVVIIEDEPRIAPSRDAIRLRNPSPETVAAADPHLAVLAGCGAPPVWALPCPALVSVRARTPRAAAARLAAGHAPLAPAPPPHAVARLVADAVPLLLWIDPLPRLGAVYEVMPGVDPSGEPCLLQMLAAADPGSAALVPTGAIPRDPELADAWNA